MRSGILMIAAFAVVAAGAVTVAEPKPWGAGVARVNITPEHLMWMSGYASRKKPAEGKLQDLWAKALVLKDPDGRQAVLVTMDLVGIPRDLSQSICQELQRRYGLERAAVALNVSHTHSGPVVGNNLLTMYDLDEQQLRLVARYAQTLQKKVVDVVGKALENVAPAQVSWGTGKATFAVNRRNNKEADVPHLRTTGQLKGPVDHDLSVLAVREASGRLRAVICGYACHATVLDFQFWSGDYPGFAQLDLEKAHPDAVAMFWAGCGADQNPIPRREVRLAEEYGRQLARGVEEVLRKPMTPLHGSLALSYREIDLPFADLPTREQIVKDTISENRYVAARAKQLLRDIDRDGSLKETYPYPVQVWQLGKDLTFIILGGEVVVDYALRLKTELGPKNTWLAGYSNDVMAYIPSLRVLKEGGYEGGGAMVYYGLPAIWAPKVEELIVAEVHKQVEKVRGGSHRAEP